MSLRLQLSCPLDDEPVGGFVRVYENDDDILVNDPSGTVVNHILNIFVLLSFDLRYFYSCSSTT